MTVAKSFIHTIKNKNNAAEYAYIYTPHKINGKKDNSPVYLGRVIDKDRGIFQSRARGTFSYSIDNGYGDVVTEANGTLHINERLILDFGDAYCLYETLKKHNLFDMISNIVPGKEDTMMSVLGFKLLASASNRYAEDWWEGSYARILFPNAKLRSQRLSEFYEQLGDEAVNRRFFQNYLCMFFKNKPVGVLIDSTGMPNDIHFSLTAVNTHNGVTSKESRLLLVVDRESGMPLFFRYNAGNIVDVTTLRATFAELDAYGVKIDYAIVDAGYYSANNIRSLYGDDDKNKPIPFLTRIGPNLTLYKQLISEHADGLFQAEYMLMQRDRLLSVKRVAIDLFNHQAYAYVALDHARREEEIYRYAKTALNNNDFSHEEMNAAMKEKGLFILVSSEKIETIDIMPLYYTRQAIEQIFDISKNYAELLPLRVHNEDTFRGHLMLSFVATIVFLTVNQLLKDTLFNAEGAFFILSNQKCKVFDDCVLPKEANKKMNDIYKKLKIEPPIRIAIGGNK